MYNKRSPKLKKVKRQKKKKRGKDPRLELEPARRGDEPKLFHLPPGKGNPALSGGEKTERIKKKGEKRDV